jgi:methylmalonyl-CoA mutase cobalamin-binding subunit
MRSKVLMGTCGSDVHSVANFLIEKCLVDAGMEVRNLGVSVPDFEWLEELDAFAPNLLLVGSMNGDLQPLVELIGKVSSAGFQKNHILVGGKLRLGSEGESLAPFLNALGVHVLDSENPTFEFLLDKVEGIIHNNTKPLTVQFAN